MVKITVLTRPVSPARSARRFVRHALDALAGRRAGKPLPPRPKYGGHYAVTRSLVEGLRKIGAPFNHDPMLAPRVARVVLVLSGIDALRQMIDWKRRGRISHLLAGPNLVVLPSEHDALVVAPEIDTYLINSEWTLAAYGEDQPALRSRLRIWPAGVDTDDFAPSPAGRDPAGRTVLVYAKNAPDSLVSATEQMLAARGWDPRRLTYGSYAKADFKALLGIAAFAVFLSATESQGLALAEAWSMDVPTLCWDPRPPVKDGRQYSQISSCPWLTPATGARWETAEDFDRLLARMGTLSASFAPRRWVLEHMSDAVSARLLLQIVGETVAPPVPGDDTRQCRPAASEATPCS